MVPLTREWVGPALQGQELLRRELELLVRALGGFRRWSASSRSPQTSVARGARTAYPPPCPGSAVALAGLPGPVAPLGGAGVARSGISSSNTSWFHGFCASGCRGLLDVPHVGDVLAVIQLQGAEQPPLQSLPEIIWPCRHLQGLEGVVKHPRLVGGWQLGLESLQAPSLATSSAGRACLPSWSGARIAISLSSISSVTSSLCRCLAEDSSGVGSRCSLKALCSSSFRPPPWTGSPAGYPPAC